MCAVFSGGGRVPGEIIGILDLDSESPDCPQLPLLSHLSVFLRLCCVCVSPSGDTCQIGAGVLLMVSRQTPRDCGFSFRGRGLISETQDGYLPHESASTQLS